MININHLDNPSCQASACELMDNWQLETSLQTAAPITKEPLLLESQLELAKSQYLYREHALMQYYSDLVDNSNLPTTELNRKYESIMRSLEGDARKYRELESLFELYR